MIPKALLAALVLCLLSFPLSATTVYRWGWTNMGRPTFPRPRHPAVPSNR
jgi:hypothetical protein